VYPKSTTWTAEHRRWLSRQQFAEAASDLVFADLLAAVDGLSSRKAAIALRLSELATDEQWWPTVARLRSFRGIDTLTAFSLHLELGGDWRRFEQANSLSAWLGLTPSLNQSGESSRQGSITKTGSMLARRLLVESAWHYSRQPRLGATLANRQHGQPDHVLAIANRAQQRLYRVNRKMRARGKPHNVTIVACARELSCFLWAAATPADSPTVGGPGRRATGGRHARYSYEQHPLRASRSILDSARRQHETRALGYPTPASSDWQRRQPSPASRPTDHPSIARHADAINPAHLTNQGPYQV
jgi:transposase